MIETENQKLIRQNKQYRERIYFLENELKKLSLSLTECRSKLPKEQPKEMSLINTLNEGCFEVKSKEATTVEPITNEQFIIPYKLLGKVSLNFLREIMKKNKLDLKTMNLSLAGFAYDLQKQTLKLHGSLSFGIEEYFKPDIGYDSANYFNYLDMISQANKTDDLLKKMEDKDNEHKGFVKIIEENTEAFEKQRIENPDFINSLKPIVNEKLMTNFNIGSPNYNQWVSNWLSNR